MPYRDLRSARDYQRRKREERIAAGLCPTCGKVPPAPGFKVCDGCRKMNNRNAREWQRKRRPSWDTLGLCPSCSGRRFKMDGRSQCAVCAEARDELRERQKQEPAA